MEILGIDIGGTGIKGAPVNLETGELAAERHRIPTPRPAKPEAVAAVVNKICKHFNWQGPVGYGFPAVVLHGVTKSAANVHSSWIDTDTQRLFREATGLPARVINDADAAGMAEMRFGAGKDRQGVVVIITIGTGLGSAVFVDGVLVPNTEFGHLEMNGRDAETQASDAARKRENLTWKEWGGRFNQYLQMIERLICPDVIILGGGGSKKFQRFSRYLNVHAEVVPAVLQNEAGIVGAALAAALA